jgi:hypothetical protein
MMTAVLDELSGRKEQRAAEFHAAVERILTGEEIAADELELICLRAGKPTHEFASVVRQRQQRAKDRARLEELPAIRQQIDDVNAQIADAEAAFEAARQDHMLKVYNLAETRNGLITQLTDLNGLKGRLIKGCRVSELDERSGAINLYLAGLLRKRSEAKRQLATQQAALRDASRGQVERWWLDRDARSQPLPADVDDSDPLAIYKRRVIRASAAIDEIDRREGEYLQEQAAIRRQQFEW